jgi:predicted MFS family arabinose efflux permease
MMIVFLVLMGIAGGGYHPSAAPLISASVEPKKRGQALGFHLIGGSGSFFLAPLIAAAIAAAWGWRGSFIGLAVPTTVLGIIFYVLLGRRVDMSKAQPVITDHHDETLSPPGHLRRLVAFMTLSIFTSAVTFATIAFIPLFMVDHFGVGEEAAAAFLAIIYSAGLWASPLGGYLSDRLGRVPVALVVCLITGPVIYLLNLVPYGLGIGAVLLIIGIVMYIRMPVSEAYIVGQTSERRRSMILGIYYFSSMEGGGLLTPVMGSLIDRFGFHSSFTIASAAIVVVTLICSLFLRGSQD